MDFSLGEDRQMLIDTLSRYFEDKAGFERRLAAVATDEGYDPRLWRGLAELGVTGALFSPGAGGLGGTGFDIGAVFGQVGDALAAGPFLTTLMAGGLLEKSDEFDTLNSVMSGEAIVTLAHEPPMEAGGGAGADVTARADDSGGDGWRLTGARGVVDYLASATHVVVTGTADGEEAAFLLDPTAGGVTIAHYPLIDGGSAGELHLDAAPARRLAHVDAQAIAAARAAGLVAIAWEAVAIMDQLRDRTLDYLRTRKQFGVPIGKFQALRHRMATVALEIEQARSAAIAAADAFDKDPATRDLRAAAAKYTIGKVGSLIAEEAIQLHGGIGMTWELPLSHYAKRLVLLGHVLGDEDEHLARYIALSRDADDASMAQAA